MITYPCSQNAVGQTGILTDGQTNRQIECQTDRVADFQAEMSIKIASNDGAQLQVQVTMRSTSSRTCAFLLEGLVKRKVIVFE